MKDINIAAVLLRERKEKGITQDELAQYIGVSKASVSKWETGTSFPDIAFLPQLASYFDISIDELLGYNPQMTKDNIRTLRQRLNTMVTQRPIEETLEECREIIKKYYSCYPLLMQMGLFLYNNIAAFTDEERRNEVLREIIDLFTRIRENSDDVSLTRLALQMESQCYLAFNDPDSSLVLLEGLDAETYIPSELLVAAAYQMKGDIVEAKRNIQVGLYQNLAVQMNYFSNYLMLVLDDTEAFEGTITRADSSMRSFELETLHPYLYLSLELMKAIGLAQRGETERCIDVLERYTHTLARIDMPVELHGDSYFNLIDPWIAESASGSHLPRNSALVKSDFISLVSTHPAFAALADEARYKAIQAKLERLRETT